MGASALKERERERRERLKRKRERVKEAGTMKTRRGGERDEKEIFQRERKGILKVTGPRMRTDHMYAISSKSIFAGKKIMKEFQGEAYTGVVISTEPTRAMNPITGKDQDVWTVWYEDADEEEMDKTELKHAMQVYEDRTRASGTENNAEDVMEEVCDEAIVPPRLTERMKMSDAKGMTCAVCRKRMSILSPAKKDRKDLKRPLQLYQVGAAHESVHLCCALKHEANEFVPNDGSYFRKQHHAGRNQSWWDDLHATDHYPLASPCRQQQVLSSDANFRVGEIDLCEEFFWRIFIKQRACHDRFVNNREPPYSIHNEAARCYRQTDRGTIGFQRGLTSYFEEKKVYLTIKQVERGDDTVNMHTDAELTVFAAILYRTINRLSTFSRWSAYRDVPKALKSTQKRDAYTQYLFGKGKFAKEAASGADVRDKWARSYWTQNLQRETATASTIAFPYPCELEEFLRFCILERNQGRAVLTGAHQTIAYANIEKLLRWTRDNLTELTTMISSIQKPYETCRFLVSSPDLACIGPFYAWQIYCDLKDCGIVPRNVDIDEDFAVFGKGSTTGALLLGGLNMVDAQRLATGYDSFSTKNTSVAMQVLSIAKHLVKHQRHYFTKLGVLDEWDAIKFAGQDLDLMAVEHLLCGFSSWIRTSCSNAIGIKAVDKHYHVGWQPNFATDLEYHEMYGHLYDHDQDASI